MKMERYIELHLHLDGSLPIQTVRKLMKMNNIYPEGYSSEEEIGDDLLKELLMVSPDCRDLNEYLKKFDFPLLLLQNRESLKAAVFELGIWLQEQNVGYAEIRFALQLHTRRGLTQREVADAAIEGIREYRAAGGAAELRLIFCLMRGDMGDPEKYEMNMETVRIASLISGASDTRGVLAGLDLAGAEALFPTKDYRPFFSVAREKGIPFTIHAGEAAGPESVWEAIDMGAKRIGHGIAAARDEKLMRYMAGHGIVVEMCPTSNLQTGAVRDIRDYPLRTFLEYGIPVTVNSDNCTVSGTTIKEEFELLRKEIGLTRDEEERIRNYATICIA
ncbi:MAG: adenosine deaminase [Eubacterium sp.]|nr:adenosine deaminase [Eubacterium sp.]